MRLEKEFTKCLQMCINTIFVCVILHIRQVLRLGLLRGSLSCCHTMYKKNRKAKVHYPVNIAIVFHRYLVEHFSSIAKPKNRQVVS